MHACHYAYYIVLSDNIVLVLRHTDLIDSSSFMRSHTRSCHKLTSVMWQLLCGSLSWGLILVFKKKVLKSSGRLTWVGLQQLQEQCYPSYNVSYFRVSKQWYSCQCLGFLTCAHTFYVCNWQGSCTNTVTGSALKFGLGRKSLVALGNQTHIGIAPGFSIWCSTSIK